MRRTAICLVLATSVSLTPVTAVAQGPTASFGSLGSSNAASVPPPPATTPAPPIPTNPPIVGTPAPQRTTELMQPVIYQSEDQVSTEIWGSAHSSEGDRHVDADGMEVQLRRYLHGDWQSTSYIPRGEDSFRITGLERVITYEIRVRHRKGDIWTNWSGEMPAVSLTGYPGSGLPSVRADEEYIWPPTHDYYVNSILDPTVLCSYASCVEDWGGRVELQFAGVEFRSDVPTVWDGPIYALPAVMYLPTRPGLFLYSLSYRTPPTRFLAQRLRVVDMWGNAGPWHVSQPIHKEPDLNPDFELVP